MPAARPSARQSLYNWRWQKARDAYLRFHPLCVMCQKSGIIKQPDVVDHIIPHHGDLTLFWDRNNWQPLCKDHHNIDKQRLEKGGKPKQTIGRNGWPVEKEPKKITASGLFWPTVRPSTIPLVILCGPPAAGKSTYVMEHAASGDTVIDLDDIIAELYPDTPRTREWKLRRNGLLTRNVRLASLTTAKHGHAWFCTGAPKPEDRMRWATMLKGRVHVLATPLSTCIARIQADPSRRVGAAEQIQAARQWWEDYAPAPCDQPIG